jgi:hypothetical protein
MAKNVYHEGKLIPVKNWDYDKKLPKAKKVEQPVTEVVAEPEVEQTQE